MTKLLATAVVLVALTGATAHARTFNYACRSENGEDRYALTVNTDRNIVKMAKHGPPDTLTTFRILKVDPECGKYGWTLSNGAMFCTATQGSGTLDWRGNIFDCDQANTE